MKRLLIILMLILLINVSYAQPLKFEEVIQFEGKSKTELTNRSKMWIAQKFTPNAENYSEDAEVGILIVKSYLEYYFERKQVNAFAATNAAAALVLYTIMIEIKDGRVKFSMIDIIHKSGSGEFYSCGIITEGDCLQNKPKWKPKVWVDIKKQVDEEFYMLKKIYIDHINNQGNNDW